MSYACVPADRSHSFRRRALMITSGLALSLSCGSVAFSQPGTSTPPAQPAPPAPQSTNPGPAATTRANAKRAVVKPGSAQSEQAGQAAQTAPATKPAPAPPTQTEPAQTEPAQTEPAPQPVETENGLDLPDTIQTFGPGDPNLRKATAIVNGEVITGTDIDQRVALVRLAQTHPIPESELPRLRAQIVRQMIDETLQIQEARAQDIKIEPNEVNDNYNRVAQRFHMTPAKFSTYLAQNASSEQSMKRQITGDLSWNRLVGRQVEPFVNVSDEEVQSVLSRMEQSKGATEFQLGEIFLASTPEDQASVAAHAQRIIEQLQQGASFAAYARQFSQASTAAVGGDLGWVRTNQLPAALAEVVQDMSVGELVGPVQVAGGFSILYLNDKRQVLTTDPRDAVVSLRQIAIDFAPGSSRQANEALIQAFSQATRSMGGCGRAADVAKRFGGEVVDNDNIRIRDIAPQVQQMLLNMAVGEATPTFGSPEQGVQVLVLCGRDDPQGEDTPDAAAIKGEIEQDRIEQRSQRYLRELRRDAVIEYR